MAQPPAAPVSLLENLVINTEKEVAAEATNVDNLASDIAAGLQPPVPFKRSIPYGGAIIFEPLNSNHATDSTAAGNEDTMDQPSQIRTQGGQLKVRQDWDGVKFDGVVDSKIPQPTKQLSIGYLRNPFKCKTSGGKDNGNKKFARKKSAGKKIALQKSGVENAGEPGDEKPDDEGPVDEKPGDEGSVEKVLAYLSEEARAKFDRVHQDRDDKYHAGEVSSVSVRPHSHENDVTAHIDLVFHFNWKDEDGTARKSQASLVFTPRNTEVNMPVPVATPDEIPEVFQGHDECSIYAHDKVFSMTGTYTAAKVWTQNLTGEGDFGPHTALVRSLSSYAVHGARFFIIVESADQLRYDMENYQTDATEEIAEHPYEKFWMRDAYSSSFRPMHIDDTARPPPSAARVAFEDMDEFLAREVLALRRDRDYEELRTKKTYTNLSARFVAMPGEGNENALLVFIEEDPSTFNPLRLQDEEKVLIRIHTLNPENVEGHYWHGGVIPALPNLPLSDRIIFARRPWDSSLEDFGGKDVSLLGDLPRWEDIGQTALMLLNTQKPRAVDIKLIADNKSYRRRYNSLATAFDLVRHEESQTGSSMTADLLTCNRLDRLPRVDMLADFTDEEREELMEDLSSNQQKALHLFRKMPGGFGIIMGCAGAGKSYMLVMILAHYLRHIVRTTQAPHPGLAALILTPINANADGLINSFEQAFKNAGIDEAIVIRKFARQTDRALFTQDADSRAYDRAKVHPRAFNMETASVAMEEASEVARLVFDEFASHRDRYFHKDKRVKEKTEPFSVASWMIRILNEQVNHSAIQRARAAIGDELIRILRSALDKYDSLEATQEDRGTLTTTFNDAIKIFIGAADVVIATCSEGIDEAIVTAMKPRIFAIDEAAAAQSVDSYAWVCFPGCKYRIFIGDLYQNRPVVNSPGWINPFVAQMKLPYMARLILAGFPYVTQFEQHRFVEQIADVLGRAFYPAPLKAAASSAANRADGKAKFIDFMTKVGINQHELRAPIIMVDVGMESHEAISASRSKFNPKTAAATWEMLGVLKDEGGYSPSEIGILTPYTAQRTIHEHIALLKRSQGQPADYLIETAQRAQSLSRDILILDVPNSRNLGFLKDATRVNTALSRCRYGIIVVCVRNLLANSDFKPKAINMFIRSIVMVGGHFEVEWDDEAKMVLSKIPDMKPRGKYTAPCDVAGTLHTGKRPKRNGESATDEGTVAEERTDVWDADGTMGDNITSDEW